MEVGVKFYSHNKVSEEDFDFADFVEILAVPGNPIGVFGSFRAKFRVHCPHDAFNFNPSNAKREERNTAMLRETIMAADQLNADRIVVHAGYNSPKLKIRDCKKNAIAFLKANFDSRICIENLLPKDGDLTWVAYSPEEIAEFRDLGFRFCLDFGHAVGTASHFGLDYKDYISRFVNLKPDYFHLSGTINGVDRHQSILVADTDLEFMKQIIRRAGKPVCLETPVITGQRRKEVEFLKK